MESVDGSCGYVCVCSQRSGVKGSLECARLFGGSESACMLGPVEFRRLELYYQYQQGLANIGQETGSFTTFGGGSKGVAVVGSSYVEGLCRGCGSRSRPLVRVDSSVEGGAFGSAFAGSHVAGEGDKSGSSVSFPGGSYLSHDQLLEPKGSDSVVELKCTTGDGGCKFLGVAEPTDAGCESSEVGEEKLAHVCVSTVGSVELVSSDEERKRKNLRNREARKARKERKKKRQSEGYDWRQRSVDESSDLRKSLERKWRMENDLATERARRQLEVLTANDIESEVKKYRTKISAETEKNMVSIETTHAKLRQTGNLPDEQGGGFAETVVSGVPGLQNGGATISPDSSASMAEYRACQKALLDSEKALLEERKKLQIVKDRFGIPVDFLDTIDKETWTIGDHNEDALDAWYPNGYGINTAFSPEGKFHAIKV